VTTVDVFVKLTRTELRLALREPMFTFFVLMFPTLLVIILGSIPSFREPSEALGGLRVIDVYVGIAILLSLAMLAVQVLPAALATYRERGILRRFATTPVPPVKVLGAHLAMNLICAVGSTAIVLTVGRLVFDVPLAENLAAFVVAFLLCAAGVAAVGLFIAAVVPNGQVGNAAGTLLFFPMMFFAGLWTPREVMPGVLQRISDFTPLGAGERAVFEAMTGHWPNLLSVTVLVAYLVVFGALAARLFRWE
jgi:ABC-2 type transport system permease protein